MLKETKIHGAKNILGLKDVLKGMTLFIKMTGSTEVVLSSALHELGSGQYKVPHRYCTLYVEASTYEVTHEE